MGSCFLNTLHTERTDSGLCDLRYFGLGPVALVVILVMKFLCRILLDPNFGSFYLNFAKEHAEAVYGQRDLSCSKYQTPRDSRITVQIYQKD